MFIMDIIDLKLTYRSNIDIWLWMAKINKNKLHMHNLFIYIKNARQTASLHSMYTSV